MESISLEAAYSSGSSEVEIEGNAAGNVDDSSASINGSYKQSDSWSTEGTGSKSGSASYTVKANRTYNGVTNQAFIEAFSGNVTATGNGTFDNNGSSISFSASSQVNVRTQ
jgi:hypothetical protein